MKIAFTYNGSRRHITEEYLSDTFNPGSIVHFDLDLFRPNISVFQLLEIARRHNQVPDALAHVHTPGLPHDLTLAPLPTVSLDIDSYGWTESRIRWSMLFDYVFVWHLSHVPLYRAAGHPKVFAFPHAVDARLFGGDNSNATRPLDLGWIGEIRYGQYARRRRIIESLATQFKMNDFRKRHTKAELVDVYRHCKIVVNVSRDDFPQDANMRCYEGMAGGALLITGMPTELTEWGFSEGTHFVGWRTEAEIPELVKYYLHQEKERTRIACCGQELTLSNFTYQHCRDKMIAMLQEHQGQLFAPARSWPAEDIGLAYLEYYYRYQLLDATLEEFRKLREANPRAYREGLPMVLKTMRHVLGRSLF